MFTKCGQKEQEARKRSFVLGGGRKSGREVGEGCPKPEMGGGGLLDWHLCADF